MTHFQRQLLAFGQGLTSENTMAKRNPFTYATAYWSLNRKVSSFQCHVLQLPTVLSSTQPLTSPRFHLSTPLLLVWCLCAECIDRDNARVDQQRNVRIAVI